MKTKNLVVLRTVLASTLALITTSEEPLEIANYEYDRDHDATKRLAAVLKDCIGALPEAVDGEEVTVPDLPGFAPEIVLGSYSLTYHKMLNPTLATRINAALNTKHLPLEFIIRRRWCLSRSFNMRSDALDELLVRIYEGLKDVELNPGYEAVLGLMEYYFNTFDDEDGFQAYRYGDSIHTADFVKYKNDPVFQ